MSARQQAVGNGWFQLCNLTVTGALTGVGQTPIIGLQAMKAVMLEGIFTFGSGGTSADVWIQSSLDLGATWFDIANFHFLVATASKLSAVNGLPATPFTAGTAPGDGVLAANTVLNGILGDRLRAKVTTVGTYGGGTLLVVNAVPKG